MAPAHARLQIPLFFRCARFLPLHSGGATRCVLQNNYRRANGQCNVTRGWRVAGTAWSSLSASPARGGTFVIGTRLERGAGGVGGQLMELMRRASDPVGD